MFRSPDLELDFALDLAEVQGGIIGAAYKSAEPLEVDVKDDGTKVTNIDRLVSNNTVAAYGHRGIPVISEEGGSISYEDLKRAEYGLLKVAAMVVDPVDGTNNYITRHEHRLPRSVAAYSLAMIRRELAMGVVSLPLLDEHRLYGAVKGGLAYRYDRGSAPIRLEVADSSITKGVVLVSDSLQIDSLAVPLFERGFRPLQLPGAVFKAMMLVDPELLTAYTDNLQGFERPIGYVSTRTNLHDHAATAVLVESAGGIATSLSGGSLATLAQGCVMASNPATHRLLLEAVAG